jgi:hypothetical protein
MLIEKFPGAATHVKTVLPKIKKSLYKTTGAFGHWIAVIIKGCHQ